MSLLILFATPVTYKRIAVHQPDATLSLNFMCVISGNCRHIYGGRTGARLSRYMLLLDNFCHHLWSAKFKNEVKMRNSGDGATSFSLEAAIERE
jgi:hypothetical protein